MSRVLEGLSWVERGEVFDRTAKARLEDGDHRGWEAYRLNAMTMRLMAVEDGEMTVEQAQEVNAREYPLDRDDPRCGVDA